MGNSGKGLGIFALLIAIGALGFGLYQFILPSPSEGPKIYSASKYNTTYLDFNTFDIITSLNLTYNTKAGDSVLLEFSCQIYIDSSGGSNTIHISFLINGSAPSPYKQISITGVFPSTYYQGSGLMRYNIESSPAGTHFVGILASIDVESTGSYVKYCTLTATVY